MTTDQKKKYEEAAKAKYSYMQTSIYRVTAEQIAIDHYITGAEEGKKEGWNEALDAVNKWALSMWGANEHSIFTELKKLRK